MDVNDLIKQITDLQKQTNEASVKKQAAINRKESIEQDIEELRKKTLQEFGCDIQNLEQKKEEYTADVLEKINNLKKILGIE